MHTLCNTCLFSYLSFFFLPKTLQLPCILTEWLFPHSFLLIPICPVPLLGHNILSSLGATFSWHLPSLVTPIFFFPYCFTGPYLKMLCPKPPKFSWPPRMVYSTTVVATHHQLFLVCLKDPFSFLPNASFLFLKPATIASSPLLSFSYLKDSSSLSICLVTLPFSHV